MKPYMKTSLRLGASFLVLIVALFAILLVFGVVDWLYAVEFVTKTAVAVGVLVLAGVCLGYLSPANRK